MITIALEKAWTWPRTTHNYDIVDRYGLAYLAITRYIQHDLPLLIVLVDHWDQDYCTFHLPTSEILVSLLDMYLT